MKPIGSSLSTSSMLSFRCLAQMKLGIAPASIKLGNLLTARSEYIPVGSASS